VLLGHVDALAEAASSRLLQKAYDALTKLSSVFDAMYSSTGRPSIPPERLLKATLLMALYSVRSKRQFCEQLDYNLLFRWFLDMDMTEASFDLPAVRKNGGSSSASTRCRADT
jgi:transposase